MPCPAVHGKMCKEDQADLERIITCGDGVEDVSGEGSRETRKSSESKQRQPFFVLFKCFVGRRSVDLISTRHSLDSTRDLKQTVQQNQAVRLATNSPPPNRSQVGSMVDV